MLDFEVKDSPDKLVLGIHRYYYPTITIGREKGDLLIEDDTLKDPHISFEIREQGVFVRTEMNTDYIHVNGKKLAGKKLLKPDDIIKIGNTTLRLNNFFNEPPLLKKNVIQENLKIIDEEEYQINFMLDLLEDELRSLK